MNIARFVETAIHSPRDQVLDLGCGDKVRSKPYGDRATTVDAWEAAEPDILMDIGTERLPFEDSSFEVVLMIDIIEHLTREQGAFALSEAQRVCSRRLLLITPTEWSDNRENTERQDLPVYYGNHFNLHRSRWDAKDFLEDKGWMQLHRDNKYYAGEWVPPRLSKPGYSALMGYVDRPDHLHNTLLSYDRHYGGRDRFEVIIAEDPKNRLIRGAANALRETVDQFPHLRVRIIEGEDGAGISRLYNEAAEAAQYEHLMLTNPECYHRGDILGCADAWLRRYPYHYLVFGCECVEFPGRLGRTVAPPVFQHKLWYQHSRKINRQFHFCSVLSRSQYFEVGGFCEEFDQGVAFDDNDFVEQVRAHGIFIKVIDEPNVAHQAHEPVVGDRALRAALERKNKQLLARRRQERKAM